MLDPNHHVPSTAAVRPSGTVGAGEYQLPLDRLYERFDAVAAGRTRAAGENLHQIVLDRLAANRAYAEAAGWTACALERDGGLGRLRVTGVAPSAIERSIVPDWTSGVATEAAAAAAAADAALRPPARAATAARPPRIVRG